MNFSCENLSSSTLDYEDELVAGCVQPYDESHIQIKILMTILYSAIAVCGILGNVITCVVVSRNKVMYTATNYYLFNMAVSDLLLICCGLPHEMQILWSPRPYGLGEAFCVGRILASETSTNASVLTIMTFTVERYIGICHPLKSHTMAQLSRVLKVISLIWLFALLGAIPQAIQFGISEWECKVVNAINYTFELSTFLFFICPMTLITVVYIKIGLELNRSQPPGDSLRTYHTKNIAAAASDRNKGVIKMLVAVVIAFFICFAPHQAQRLLAFYGDPTQEIQIIVYKFLNHISGVFFYLSTCINPILYHIMSYRFRQALKNTMSQCGGKSSRDFRRTASMGERSSRTALTFTEATV